MGNLCGKPSKSDPFSQPGRTLSSAPSKPTRAPVPSAAQRNHPNRAPSGDKGRSLGGANTPADVSEARRKAAAAAEERARATQKPKGKLSSQLQEQKAKTRTNTLEQASADTRRMRDADEAAEARQYN
ncbi:MAG: hypothetical protein M1824_000960 [Vezdaea acicularis]|nr:MAG: hypothetical protein M1824_000960 [Vezdaea acicularis]